jgi:hypothetical protein
MAFQPKKRSASLSPQALRVRRLDATAKAAARWLILQGLCYLLLGDRSASWFHLRFITVDAPVMRNAGLAFLLLGFFLRRSLREPENQGLSLDLLMLLFWCQTLITSTTWFRSDPVLGGEWVVAAFNLGFALALTILRTKSTQMAPGSPGAMEARQAARETILRLKSLLEEGKRTSPLPDGTETPKGADKPFSEASPHLD